MKLIFVYNANSGIVAAAFDAVHKAIVPETYGCNLCRVTYGALLVKSEWKRYIATLPHDAEFLHRDEFRVRYPRYAEVSLPAVFQKEGPDLRQIVTSADIARAVDVQDMIALVKRSLSNKVTQTT